MLFGGSFSVTLPLKKPIRSVVSKLKRTPAQPLTDRQTEILEILKVGPLSREQVMKKSRITTSARTTQRELAKLKKLRLITSQGAGKLMLLDFD
jgi:predicted HTH transcriptional regulator